MDEREQAGCYSKRKKLTIRLIEKQLKEDIELVIKC